ncbi:excisionase [Robbsia andropogonis]|uniref:excisionase n=2 Tax=Robbsia andropogonis TaxID=28092 RepID=UPI00344D1AEE
MATAQMVPIAKWAESVFGEHGPCRNTLRKWVSTGKIRPAPVRVGRSFFCKPDAQYFDPKADLRERMRNGS